MVLTLQPGEWYAWEVFPSSAKYPNNAPVFLSSMARSNHLRGALELELRFANGPAAQATQVEVHPKKKSTGYWVCRLHSGETPEPTVVISILNAEWLYVHCPALRKYLGEPRAERPLQALLTQVYS